MLQHLFSSGNHGDLPVIIREQTSLRVVLTMVNALYMYALIIIMWTYTLCITLLYKQTWLHGAVYQRKSILISNFK